MNVKIDPDVQAAADFLQSHVQAERLVGVAAALAQIAPALWGHLQAQSVRALLIQDIKPTQSTAT